MNPGNPLHLQVVGGNARPMTTHLDDFASWLGSWSTSSRTVKDRVTVVRAALRDTPGGPAEVTTADLERWLADPRFSPWTRVTYYSHVRSFFGWLHETGRRADNPTAALRRPGQPRGLPRPLASAEAAAAIAHASGNLHAWLLLGLLAGLRAHEIAKLRGEDVSPEGLYVVGKGQQGALLPTHPEVWALAQSYPRHGWWFPSPRSLSGHVTAGWITTRVSRYFDRLGIEGSIHRCRHS